jgi:hypothetical protein
MTVLVCAEMNSVEEGFAEYDWDKCDGYVWIWWCLTVMELVRCSSVYFLNLWNVSARSKDQQGFELWVLYCLKFWKSPEKNGLRHVQEILSEMVWSFQQ